MRYFTAVVLFAVSLVLLAGCTGIPDGTPTQPEPPGAEEMKSIILSANQALNERPVRYTSSTILDSGETIATFFESVPPDRVHLNNGTTEFIVIGDAVYMKSEDAWQKVDINPANFRNPDSQSQLETSIANIEYVGQEDFDGQMMDIYKYTSSVVQNSMPLEITNTVWIDGQDGLIYQMVNDGQVVQMNTETGAFSTTHAMTTITFTYSSEITIEVP